MAWKRYERPGDWTDEEWLAVQLLFAVGFPDRDIAPTIDRTRVAVKKKRERMGLMRAQSGQQRRHA